MNTISDRCTEEVLSALKQVADGVARTFGSHCEVVVHDLSRPQSSIVKIFNRHVTGRDVGAPIRDLIFRVLRDDQFRDGVLPNYRTETDDGKVLKCTTVLVRDAAGEPLAAFCINFDVTLLGRSQGFIGELLEMRELPLAQYQEVEVPLDVWHTLETLVDRIVADSGRSTAEMQKEDRLRVVGFLNEKGAFLIRGSVDYVAAKLGVSKFTVYNYIDESRNRAGA